MRYGVANQKQCQISDEMYQMIMTSNQIATGES
jgi:hypothetical protein